MMAKAATVASTACACAPISRRAASQITMAESRNNNAVSASAVTLSTLPWPYWCSLSAGLPESRTAK